MLGSELGFGSKSLERRMSVLMLMSMILILMTLVDSRSREYRSSL